MGILATVFPDAWRIPLDVWGRRTAMDTAGHAEIRALFRHRRHAGRLPGGRGAHGAREELPLLARDRLGPPRDLRIRCRSVTIELRELRDADGDDACRFRRSARNDPQRSYRGARETGFR